VDVPVFPGALLDRLARHPDVPAFEHAGRTTSAGEVLDLVLRFASGLRAAGLGNGSGIAVATGVTPEGFAVRTAAHVLGCRVVGVRPGLAPAHLAHLLGQDLAALAVDDAGATRDLLAAAGTVPVLRIGPGLLGEPLPPVALGRPDDVALVAGTSGSTGVPKGCVQTYRTMSAHWSWQPALWSEDTARLAAGYGRFLLFGSLSSAVIQEHLALCLLSGGTAVVPGGPPDFPRVVADLRITATLLTVPRLHHLLDALRAAPVDVSSLRSVVVAGSPLAPHRLAEGFARLGPGVLRQAYGQTEIGVVTMLTADDVARWPDALNSVGRPRREVDLEVRDESGVPLPTGATGEVWVRAPYAMTGYWDDPEETGDLLRDGWVRTRDLGRLDGDGFLHLTGRARDVIIVNAIVHYAGAIERVLASHRHVDQAHVVGAPDETTGEAAHAFVVADGPAPDERELRELVAAELGEAAVPATITVVDDVPIAPSGKPDKNALLAGISTGSRSTSA
jgi:acyl-CoA synthetase (AMP-forming)/AMP-acid ligase II